jgi:hypothetical protein
MFVFVLCATTLAHATIFSRVHGIVHDPQHRPIAGAKVTLRAGHSALTFTATTNAAGEFDVPSVPLGDYIVSVSNPGFAEYKQTLTVDSNASLVLHLQLSVAAVHQVVEVDNNPDATNISSVTPSAMMDRIDIAQTPGADKTNSLAMITDFVPGAYMTHDMLHMRGGHELNWLIDGVEIPNTNIASNVGPQIAPKDIDYIEVERGSYSADLGDRTYGMFNVLPRSGFERNRDAELVVTAGNFYQTDDQFSLGDHSEKFAWYLSVNGNRSDYGLSPAVSQPVHDASNGGGGFASLIYNRDPADQFRLVAQVRSDYYQIPKDPNPNDWETTVLTYSTSQINDGEHETDSYAALTWLHTFNAKTLAQVSPFFHFNQADYSPNANDYPVVTNADETGAYFGGQTAVSTIIARNSLKGGLYGYTQGESDYFKAVFNDGSSANIPAINPVVRGAVQEAYVEDNFRATNWLTLIAGERESHFSGALSETAFYPRVGAAVQVPKLNWVFRGFYGHFYQPPPLTSITGGALVVAQSNGDSFVPLKGERNEEHQFGVQIPFRGWLLDADTFETKGQNFLDHNNIGESSIFIPITVQGSKIQAWELTLRSPHLWKYGQAHLSYSNQLAQQIGGITGGLTCYGPSTLPTDPCYVAPGYSALDHDQRNTLNAGFNGFLPHGISGSFNVYYGSGFSNGYQSYPSPYAGAYLPSHTTADLSLGKNFGTKYTVSVTATNVGNTRVLLDNSLTFGGFHYNDPRQIFAEFRWRFKY